MDVDDICDVLENAKDTRKVVGISFDISGIYKVSISKSKLGGNYKMLIPGEMEFPCLLRLLEWEAYPSKSLPSSFHSENLVELKMRGSQLEYLWQGIQVV